MSELLSHLDPTFVGLVLGPIVHQIVAYTQDSHGKTKQFVVVLCLVLGLVGGCLYYFVSHETLAQFADAFFKIAGLSLGFASTIWAFLHKPSRADSNQQVIPISEKPVSKKNSK